MLFSWYNCAITQIHVKYQLRDSGRNWIYLNIQTFNTCSETKSGPKTQYGAFLLKMHTSMVSKIISFCMPTGNTIDFQLLKI